MMRLLLVLAAIAGAARADTLIATGPPPASAPPLPTPPARPDGLGDRFTFLPGFGALVVAIEGVHGSGMLIQPTVTRTFDRVELQGELALAKWEQDDRGPARALFSRLGVTARYQAARFRVHDALTLDLVLDAGAGVERIDRDTMPALVHPDLALGMGLRMLGAERLDGGRRILVGLEVMGRLLFAPHEQGAAIVFGLPIGR